MLIFLSADNNSNPNINTHATSKWNGLSSFTHSALCCSILPLYSSETAADRSTSNSRDKIIPTSFLAACIKTQNKPQPRSHIIPFVHQDKVFEDKLSREVDESSQIPHTTTTGCYVMLPHHLQMPCQGIVASLHCRR